MQLLGYIGEGGVDGLPYLEYTKFLSLRDKESVIVSTIIPAHSSEKQGLKQRSLPMV